MHNRSGSGGDEVHGMDHKLLVFVHSYIDLFSNDMDSKSLTFSTVW